MLSVRSVLKRTSVRHMSTKTAPALSVKRDQSMYGSSGIVATVFGATGFLGTYVVDLLGRVGSQSVIPYRGDGMNARHLKLSGNVGQVVPLPYTLKSEESIRRTLKRSNVVINLIGAKHETGNFNFHDVNVKIPYRLAKIAKEEGVERFIHVSANGAAADSKSDNLRTKYEGEQVVQDFFPNATIIRPTRMFGRQDGFLSKYGDIVSTGPFVPVVNDGDSLTQPVYVHDVANAIFNSITFSEAQGKVYELGGPGVYTEKQLVELILKETRRDKSIVNIPQPVADVVSKVWGKLPTRWKLYTPDETVQLSLDNALKGAELGFDHLGIKPSSMELNMVNGVLFSARGEDEGGMGMRLEDSRA